MDCIVSLAAPFAAHSSLGDIQMHPVKGHRRFKGVAGWGLSWGSYPPPTLHKNEMGRLFIYLQHVLHSSHNTVNYLHGQGSFLRQGERKGHKTCDLYDI